MPHAREQQSIDPLILGRWMEGRERDILSLNGRVAKIEELIEAAKKLAKRWGILAALAIAGVGTNAAPDKIGKLIGEVLRTALGL